MLFATSRRTKMATCRVFWRAFAIAVVAGVMLAALAPLFTLFGQWFFNADSRVNEAMATYVGIRMLADMGEPVSDCSSVVDSDFSWDDAVDGSGDESTDSEADSDEDDMFKDDQWCARCVIGLRVCSLSPNVLISVTYHGPKSDIEECG